MSIYIQMPAKWVVMQKISIKPEKIISEIAEYYGLGVSDIIKRSRQRAIMEARQMVMFFLRKHTGLTLKEVGEMIGGRDHTSVIHSVNTIQDLADTDRRFVTDIKTLENKLNVS